MISPHISIQKLSNFHILKNFEIWKFARVGNTDIVNLPQQEGRLFHCRFVLLWNLCSKLHQMWKFLVRQLDRWHWLLNIEKVLGPWKHRAAKKGSKKCCIRLYSKTYKLCFFSSDFPKKKLRNQSFHNKILAWRFQITFLHFLKKS